MPSKGGSSGGSTSTQSAASASASASTSLQVSLLASAIGGGLEPLVSYPFEFVKTAQQLHNNYDNFKVDGVQPNTKADVFRNVLGSEKQVKRIGFVPVIRNVWQNEGLKGFYHGVGVVAGAGAVKAVVRLGTYDRLKKALLAPDGSLSGGRSLLAGLGAGLAEAVFVVIPSETVKTRIVHSNLLFNPPINLTSTSSYNAAKTLVNSPGYHGYRALYTGVTSTLLRQGVSSMLRFGTYSSLKNLVAGSTRPGQKLPSGVTFGIGAVAGAVTVYGTMPFDCIKTRMQSLHAPERYRTTWWCFFNTCHTEGIRTLWSGATMRLCRLTLSGAVVFTVYEEIIHLAGDSLN